MQSLRGRRRGLFREGGRSHRNRLARIDWMLWGIPLAMVMLSGVLIASTQRQADYADWYQHWITGDPVLVPVGVVGLSLGAGDENPREHHHGQGNAPKHPIDAR